MNEIEIYDIALTSFFPSQTSRTDALPIIAHPPPPSPCKNLSTMKPAIELITANDNDVTMKIVMAIR
jgi:hypothetical protein